MERQFDKIPNAITNKYPKISIKGWPTFEFTTPLSTSDHGEHLLFLLALLTIKLTIRAATPTTRLRIGPASYHVASSWFFLYNHTR